MPNICYVYQLSVGKVSHGNIGKEVKWKSSNSKVAEVSDKGKVSAKKAGTATITAVSKTNSKIKATCKIRVYKKVKSIVIKDNMYHYTDSQTGRMGRGMRIKLRAVIKPSGANQKVTWSSSDSSIAKVNSKGVVTGRKLGKVTITAKSIADKKITAKYEVRVVKWCLPPTRPATVTPTKKPTKAPTKKPTKAPTKKPTKAPTMTPTKVPTKTPTKVPTVQPTQVPTKIPIQTEIREIKAYKDYDYAHDGKAGLLVVEKDLKWGAISYDGQIVVSLEYKYACDTPNNEGQTFFGNDGEYKVFDRNGKEIFKTEGTIKSVSDGVVFIEEIDSETNGYRYEYIRLDGTVLYDSGEMQLGSACYIYDINGTENYKIDMNSLCKYAGFTGEYNWKINGMNKEGNIKATYDDACGFVNGRAMVIIDGQAHFIDEDFQISEDSVPAYAVRTAGDVFKIVTPDGTIIVY